MYWRQIRRWLDRVGFVALSTGVFAVTALTGFEPVNVRLDLVVVIFAVEVLQAFLSSVAFAGFLVVSGLLFVHRLLGEPDPLAAAESAPPVTDGTGGTDLLARVEPDPVTAIVPVYRDADVLDRSVSTLLESRHPVRVAVVCEPDDAASRRRARTLASAFENVTCLVNTRYPGTKAGAINYAAEVTGTDLLGVFDADESVDPRFVGAAVELLEEADVVQGRTVPRPDGIVESLAYYESVLLSYTGRRLLYLLTGFRMAASRAVVVRRSALEATGGYDPTMLTEDYYFAFQCYRSGCTVRELLRYPSTIEAAHTVTDWWGQRKRWMRGYAQVFHALVGGALRPRGYRDLLAAAICGNTLLGSILLISLLSKVLVLLLIGAGEFVLLPVVTVVTLSAGIRALDAWNGVVDGVGLAWLLSPLLFPLYGTVAAKALLEYLVGWKGDWYQVAKTGE